MAMHVRRPTTSSSGFWPSPIVLQLLLYCCCGCFLAPCLTAESTTATGAPETTATAQAKPERGSMVYYFSANGRRAGSVGGVLIGAGPREILEKDQDFSGLR